MNERPDPGPSVVQRIHIDTDPGLDDLLAIALALASPELRVEGLTTVAGNASLDAVTDNALRFLRLTGNEIPVGRGAAGPLSLARVGAEHVHGADGRKGIPLPERNGELPPPAAAILRRSLAERRIDRLIALGPLTNVAAFYGEEPGLFEGVELIWMGGSLGAGNATPLAEFNAWADPEAVSIVCRSGLPVRVIGLDVTEHVFLRARDVPNRPFGVSPLGVCLERVLGSLMEAERPTRGDAVAVLHDPCAVAAAFEPDLFRYEDRSLDVRIEEGRERGRLVEDRETGVPPVRYAVEARSDRICSLFMSRLAAWAGAGEAA